MLREDDAGPALGMDELTYDKAELIKVVKKNREKHKREYEAGKEGYKKQLLAKLRDSLRRANSNKPVNHDLGLVKPVEFVKDYDRAIRMLEMTTQAVVKLEQTIFRQLVMDEWHWSAAYDNSTKVYAASNKGRR